MPGRISTNKRDKQTEDEVKRALTALIVIGLVAGAMVGPADAKKKKLRRKERKVELAYQFGSPGVPGAVGACLAAAGVEGSACIDVPLGPGEKYVVVEAVDATGLSPSGILAQDTDPASPGFEIFAEFCGSTPEPVAITEGLPLRISLYTVPSPTCPGLTTTGTINATLSTMP